MAFQVGWLPWFTAVLVTVGHLPTNKPSEDHQVRKLNAFEDGYKIQKREIKLNCNLSTKCNLKCMQHT